MIIIASLSTFLTPVLGTVRLSFVLFKRIAPVGIIAALDHAFSKLALQALPMTIYEIVKSCSPAVVLVLSISLGLIKPSWQLCFVVAIIVIGAILGIYRPHHTRSDRPFEYIGLVYIIVATFCAAAKSVCAQIALHGDKTKLPKPKRSRPSSSSLSMDSQQCRDVVSFRTYGTSDEVPKQPSPMSESNLSDHPNNDRTLEPEDIVIYDKHGPINPATVAFVCAIVTVATVLPFATVHDAKGLLEWYDNVKIDRKSLHLALVFIGSSLSVISNVSSFIVLRETSALTYSFVVVFQRALTVVMAVIFLHETLPLWAVGGFGLTIVGIITYNRLALHPQQNNNNQIENKSVDEEKILKAKTANQVAEFTPLFSADAKPQDSFNSASSSRSKIKSASKLQFSMATTCADTLYIPDVMKRFSDDMSSSDEELTYQTDMDNAKHN